MAHPAQDMDSLEEKIDYLYDNAFTSEEAKDMVEQLRSEAKELRDKLEKTVERHETTEKVYIQETIEAHMQTLREEVKDMLSEHETEYSKKVMEKVDSWESNLPQAVSTIISKGVMTFTPKHETADDISKEAEEPVPSCSQVDVVAKAEDIEQIVTEAEVHKEPSKDNEYRTGARKKKLALRKARIDWSTHKAAEHFIKKMCRNHNFSKSATLKKTVWVEGLKANQWTDTEDWKSSVGYKIDSFYKLFHVMSKPTTP
ncbi:uncharacterized protein LOC124272133 [Haliotis rubra]|uniref:uncharacterized protein LOC124272133 n=1 Tax=Haliotis rubra TaxID=36100 RepID=UPI001EE5FB1E|nr:uncharacterized protein LOC124272133 [Haliotis rubra]